jgi:hypothetical protein
VRANDLGKFRLRTSIPELDRDTTARDGITAWAGGRAKCKPGERLITGGSQQTDVDETVTPYVQTVEKGPVPVEQAWQVKWNSDLGGAVKEHFRIVALCLVR